MNAQAKNPRVEAVERSAGELLKSGYKFSGVKVRYTAQGQIVDYAYVKDGVEKVVYDVPEELWSRFPMARAAVSGLKKNGEREGGRRSERYSGKVRVGKTAKKHAKEAEARRATREAEERRYDRMTPEQREAEKRAREQRIAAEKAKFEANRAKKAKK